MPKDAKVVPITKGSSGKSVSSNSGGVSKGSVSKGSPTSSSTGSKPVTGSSQPNDIVEGGAPKGTFGGQITLHTYSDSVYYAHIGKVILIILIIVAIAAFIIVGLFYPECNSTQITGFTVVAAKMGRLLT